MKILIGAAVLLLAAVPPSVAQEVDVAGTWELNVTTAQGAMPPSSMVLKNDAGKIIGTISSDMGEIPVEAELKEKAIAIYGTLQTGSGPIDFALIGTIDGNSMKGTVGFGGATQGDWSATRAGQAAPQNPPPAAQDKVDVTGTWAFEVTTEMGSGTSTMTFKQEGEKLTGQYTGQYGQAALTGTVKGKDIAFAYDIAGETTTVHVMYNGTVDKDTIKGTISIGEMGNGTFTAKKSK